MAKKKYTYLDETKFNKTLQLLDYGLSQTQVSKIIGCASSTVSRVHTSGAKTYLEWKAHLKQQREERLAKEQVEKAEPNPIAEALAEAEPVRTHFSEDSVNLDRIANALERLADAWEQSPAKRKGLF